MRAWSVARSAVFAFASLAATEQSAPAEVLRPYVVLAFEDCEEPLETEVRRIVGVELRATVQEPGDVQSTATRVVVRCRGSEVDLRLADDKLSKRLERIVALSEAAPAARARLLALATAELVVASWEETENLHKPKSPAPPPPAQPMARAPASASGEQHSPSAMVEAIGVGRAFPGSGLWLLGAGARGTFTLSQPFTLSLEMTAEWGKPSRRGGQVAVRAIGGALGLGWGLEMKGVHLMPWAGVRGGAARLTGEPSSSFATSGQTQSGPWLGPEIGLAVTLFPHAAAHAVLALSGGIVLLGVQGEVTGDSNVNVLGPWAALVLGVGLTIP